MLFVLVAINGCPSACEVCEVQEYIGSTHLHLACTSVPPPEELPSGFTTALVEFNYITFDLLPVGYLDDVASESLDVVFSYCNVEHFSKHVVNKEINMTLTFNSGHVTFFESKALVVSNLDVEFFEVTVGIIEPGTFTATGDIGIFEFQHVDVETIFPNSVLASAVGEVHIIYTTFTNFHKLAFHADAIHTFNFEYSSIITILDNPRLPSPLQINNLMLVSTTVHNGNIFAGISSLDNLQMSHSYLPELHLQDLPEHSSFLDNPESGIFHTGFGEIDDAVFSLNTSIPADHLCDLLIMCEGHVDWMFEPDMTGSNEVMHTAETIRNDLMASPLIKVY